MIALTILRGHQVPFKKHGTKLPSPGHALTTHFHTAQQHASRLRVASAGELKIGAYRHDLVAIKQTPDHLGLSPPEESSLPSVVDEVVRVPIDGEGREKCAP